MIGLNAENRKPAGLKGDERLVVKLELDTEPRTTEIPAPMKAVMIKRVK